MKGKRAASAPAAQAAPNAPRRFTTSFVLLCVASVALVVATYSNTFQNSFHFDDSHVIEQNLYIRNIHNIPLFFRDAATFSAFPTNATYRPLVSTTLAIDYWIGGGLTPWPFHLSQLLMLVTLGVMTFFLALRIFDEAGRQAWNPYAALAASLLFCVHTANTETMNAIAARSELLSTMGVVGSFLVYLRVPSGRRFYLYLLPMVIGALAKTPAVIFAPLFLVFVFLFEQRLALADLFRRARREAVLAAVVKSLPAMVLAAVVFVAIESQNAPAASYGGGGRLPYLLTQLYAWLHYARLFFLPVGLSADTDWALLPHWYDPRVIAGALFVTLLVRIIWSASTTPAGRPLAFGLAWFALALLPASSIVPLAEVINEHRVFFPFIGMSIAVSWSVAVLLAYWYERTPRVRTALVPGAWVLALLAIGSQAIGAYDRNTVWRSEETLWRDVTLKSPANGRGWMNYGLTQMAQGRYVDAKRMFERAQTYSPNYATLEVNLGLVTSHLGDQMAAELHFLRAVQLQPDYPAAHTFYARWLMQVGRVAEAIPHLQRALTLSPADIDARYQLLDAYAAAGRSEDVKALASQTLALLPGDAKAQLYLNANGQSVLPVPHAGAARVETADTLLNTSLSLYTAGDFHGSIVAAQQCLLLKPDSAEAYNNIAAGYASMQQWDAAIDAAHEALRLRPDFQLARNNLAWAEGGKAKDSRPAK